jgi:hypothetical protein
MSGRKIGYIVVRCFHATIEVALSQQHARPWFYMADATAEDSFLTALSPHMTGHDIRAVVAHLALFDSSLLCEFQFIVQRAGEVELRGPNEWVSVDAWAEASWAKRWSSVVQQAHAILDAMNANYALATTNLLAVEKKGDVMRHALHMVWEANRRDLSSHVALATLRAGDPDNGEWFIKHHMGWMLDPEHVHAVYINTVVSLAKERMDLLDLVDVDVSFIHDVAARVQKCDNDHIYLFGVSSPSFRAAAWEAIARRLFECL